MAYGDFKDLTRRTASDKVLCDKAFNIAKNPKYDEYTSWLASTDYKFFDQKSSGGAIIANQQLAEELHRPVIKKGGKRKVHSSVKDNISGAYLADMQLISKYDKFQCAICVIDIFSEYACVVSLKDKKGI